MKLPYPSTPEMKVIELTLSEIYKRRFFLYKAKLAAKRIQELHSRVDLLTEIVNEYQRVEKEEASLNRKLAAFEIKS